MNVKSTSLVHGKSSVIVDHVVSPFTADFLDSMRLMIIRSPGVEIPISHQVAL